MPLIASKTGILVFFLLQSFSKKCDKILFAVKIQGMRKEFFMSRRGENIFKRKDGRWEARYIHHYENGVAKYRCLYAGSYAEVKQKRLDELSMPHNCISMRSKSLATVEQLAADGLINTRTTVKKSTYTRYCMTVKKHILSPSHTREMERILLNSEAGISLGILFLYNENHQRGWWFQKALALPSLFIRAKRGIHPFANNKI